MASPNLATAPEKSFSELSAMTKAERGDYFRSQAAARLQQGFMATRKAPPARILTTCPNLDYDPGRGHFLSLSQTLGDREDTYHGSLEFSKSAAAAYHFPQLRLLGKHPLTPQAGVLPTTTVRDLCTYIANKKGLDPQDVFIIYFDQLAPMDTQLCRLDLTRNIELLTPFLNIRLWGHGMGYETAPLEVSGVGHGGSYYGTN